MMAFRARHEAIRAINNKVSLISALRSMIFGQILKFRNEKANNLGPKIKDFGHGFSKFTEVHRDRNSQS
jgi:hypothetical protein